MASAVLEAYLTLERMMMSLDDRSDPAAERLRDLMDPLWHELDDEDREYLNSRSVESLGVASGISVADGYMDAASEELDEALGSKTGHEYSDGDLSFPLEDVLAA